MFRSRAVPLALVGLFVWLTPCTSYKQIESAEVADHGQVRVTLVDGERETVGDPRIEANSIRGLGEKMRPDVTDRVPLSIPLDQVESLEATQVSGIKTFALVFGAAAVLFGVFAIACCGDLNTLEGLGE